MKNKASFLKSIFLVALCVTSCVLLTKTTDASPSYPIFHEAPVNGPVLSCSDISLGFENLTRSFQNIVSPFTRISDDSYFQLVEKFQSTFTKVSFKYLFILQFFQCRDEHLFLDLRNLRIWAPNFTHSFFNWYNGLVQVC